MTEGKAGFDNAWELRRMFYTGVGQGISHWAHMEERLVEIAAILLGTTNRKAGLVFYSIINFHTWLNIIDELFSLDPKFAAHKDDWGTLGSDLRRLNDIRYRLAHHTIWSGPLEGMPTLRPNILDVRSKSQKFAPLTAAEVGTFVEDTGTMRDKLVALKKDLTETAASRSASPRTLFEQFVDQPPQEDAQ